MRAAFCTEFSHPLEVRDAASPECGSDQVRIEVAASAVNFADWLMVTGRYQLRPTRPFVPGFEASGIVTEVGAAVSHVSVGDRVTSFDWNGALTTDRVVEAAWTFELGDVPFVTGACLPTAYGTALHALEDRAQLRPGQTVAVLGASGGVGLASVQVARQIGARVIGVTSSDDKAKVVSDAGASVTIETGAARLRRALLDATDGAGVDVVVDPLGGSYTEAALRACAYNGKVLILGFATGDIPAVPTNLALLKVASLVGVNWGPHAEQNGPAMKRQMERIVRWAVEGSVAPMIARRFRLDEVNDAIAATIDRSVVGRVVVEMGP